KPCDEPTETRARQRACWDCRGMRCAIGCRRLGSRMRGRKRDSRDSMDLLPHLARRIEISSLVIEFPRSGDKIILTGKSGTDDHYTISVGNDSGILDGHHTWRDGGINSLAECALKLDDAGVIKCVHGEHTKCYLERP